MRSVFVLFLAVGMTAPLEPGEPQPRRYESTRTIMATSVKIVLYARDPAAAGRAGEAAYERIRDLESRLSDYDSESELSRLCSAASGGEAVAVSDDLWRVLARAQEISRRSGGAFDVTVAPVVRLWRRARRLHRLPDAERLNAARSLVDYRRLQLDPERRTVHLLRTGLGLDLGGIAKGYAADAALEVLQAEGLHCALVDVGGEIALGDPPPGRPGWRIGIAPHEFSAGEAGRAGSRLENPGDAADHLWLSGGAVATSGDFRQFLEIDGRRYSHIVDPRTGVGLQDRSSVTVVASDAMTADALASAVSVLGPRKGLKLIDDIPDAAGRVVRQIGGVRTVDESARWARLRRVADSLVSLEIPGIGAQEKAGREGPTGKAPSKESTDPALSPPVTWGLDPAPVASANAASQTEMKRYTEQIPGTNVTFDMVALRGGEFLLGSPEGEAGRATSEGPQSKVAIEPFWMGKCEVTWQEYELWGMGYDAMRNAARREQTKEDSSARDRLADAISRPTKPYSDMTFGMGRDGKPAICMTQLAAKMYCKWLSAKTGRYYRLPTEAEWEYAARAGTTTAYSFGDRPTDLGAHAWFFDNSVDMYHKVGRKKPNPWGLHDMHGNVSEWTLDAFTPGGYKRTDGTPQRNPFVVPREIYPRVVRGGSWMDDAEALRSGARKGSDRDWKALDPQIPQSIWYHTDATFVGFRVVRPLRVPTAKEAVRYDLDPAQREALLNYREYLAGRQ